MFKRRRDEPTVIVVEVAPSKAGDAVPFTQFTPLKSRDARALVVADLLLNTPLEADSDPLPTDLRKWAQSMMGEKVSDVR